MRDLFGNFYPDKQETPELKYEDYINSSAWRKIRKAKLEQAGENCERCGISRFSAKLEVHHKTYERMGHERLDDLEVLCTNCHVEADADRALTDAETRSEKFENGPLAKGFERWMDRSNNKTWRNLSDGLMSARWNAFLRQLGRKTGRKYDVPFRRISRWHQF